MTYNDIIYAKKMGGGAPALIAKSIAENGTYNAVDDEADGYSSVTVDVPYNCKFAATPVEASIENNLEDVIIPYGCTSFNSSSSKFKNLKRIHLPSTITELNGSCFSGMEKLETINIPESVEWFDHTMFSGCKTLTEVIMPANAKYWGLNFNPDRHDDELKSMFTGCYSLVSFVLPNTIEEISRGCFQHCQGLTIVNVGGRNVLPNSVKHIRREAFDGCFTLEQVNLPENLETIGDYAFSKCMELKSIVIPSTVTTIATTAFGNCESLETITVNKAEGSISGAPWGAPNATVVWTG